MRAFYVHTRNSTVTAEFNWCKIAASGLLRFDGPDTQAFLQGQLTSNVQALKRRKPGFNEAFYGFRSFGKLLDEAESRKLVALEPDEKSGGVIIKSFNPDY